MPQFAATLISFTLLLSKCIKGTGIVWVFCFWFGISTLYIQFKYMDQLGSTSNLIQDHTNLILQVKCLKESYMTYKVFPLPPTILATALVDVTQPMTERA